MRGVKRLYHNKQRHAIENGIVAEVAHAIHSDATNVIVQLVELQSVHATKRVNAKDNSRCGVQTMLLADLSMWSLEGP